jgi:hypothetical protein
VGGVPRAGTWKFRAVGQGYSGGLAQLASAHGVTASASRRGFGSAAGRPPARAVGRGRTAGDAASAGGAGAAASGTAVAVVGAAGDDPGDDDPAAVGADRRTPVGPVGGFGIRAEERMYDVLWKIFEDAARRDRLAALGHRVRRAAARQGDVGAARRPAHAQLAGDRRGPRGGRRAQARRAGGQATATTSATSVPWWPS